MDNAPSLAPQISKVPQVCRFGGKPMVLLSGGVVNEARTRADALLTWGT